MDVEKEKETSNTRKVVIMKLEHLIQAYKQNNINTQLQQMNTNKERAGTITFTKGIVASYLLDDEDIVVSMKIFFNCLTEDKLTITNQLSYTIKILNIIQNTIMLLSNIPQKECNMILERLGLFDNTFRSGKKIKYLEHSYRIEVIDGLLCLSINEIELNEEIQ